MSSQAPAAQPQSSSPTIKTRFYALIDFDFMKTIVFYFKVAFIVLSIGGAIAAGWRFETFSATRFYHFVAVTCILVHFNLILFYFFMIMQKFTKVPWILVQLIVDAFFIVFYIIASSVCTHYARIYINFDHFGAAAFFGFGLVILHILEAIYFIIQWKRGSFYFSSTTTATSTNTQGGVTTTTTKTVITKQNEQIVY